MLIVNGGSSGLSGQMALSDLQHKCKKSGRLRWSNFRMALSDASPECHEDFIKFPTLLQYYQYHQRCNVNMHF